MNGTVKFFNRAKAFGFIAGEDGKEYFVHQTALGEGVSIDENDQVTFDVEDGDRGPKAVNVVKGGAEPAAEEEPAEESAEEEPAAEEEEPSEEEENAE